MASTDDLDKSTRTSPNNDMTHELEGQKNTTTRRMDGGTAAWRTLAAGWIITFTTLGYSNSFGVFQEYYHLTSHSTPSNISWIGSTQLFLMFMFGLPGGKLLDAGKGRAVILAGSLLFVFSMFMVSLAQPTHYYQVFLSQGIGLGIGAGLLYTPALAVQGHHWKKNRALAMGVVITGSSTGGIVYPIMLNKLIQNPDVGFAGAVRAAAFLSLGMLILANLLIVPVSPPKDGSEPVPNAGAAIRDVPFMIAVAGVFLATFGFFFPYFYLQVIAVLNGVDRNLAFYTISIMNGSSIIGRTIPNFIAERIGSFNVLIPATISLGALTLGLLGVKSTTSVIIFAVLYGIASGTFLSLIAPMVASFTKHPSEVGLRLGIAFALTSWAALSGNPIIGALLTRTFIWERPIAFSVATTWAGVVLMLISRQQLVKKRGTQRV